MSYVLAPPCLPAPSGQPLGPRPSTQRSQDRGITFEAVEGWPAALKHLPAWQALAGQASPWFPFQEPDWSIVWWRHWSRSGRGRRDRFLLWLGRDGRGELRAVLPSVLSERPGTGPLRLRVLRPVGPDPNLTEIQPILCRPEDTVAAHEGFWRTVRDRQAEWDAFRWDALPARLASGLRRVPGVEHLRDLPDYVLPLDTSWEGFWSSVPRRVRKAVRRGREAAQRAGLDLRFSVVADREELTRLLPEFFALHGARAAAPGMSRHPDIYAKPRARAFLADLAAGWRPGGFLALVQRHQGRTVACRLAFRQTDTLYLYDSGFDPAYARYSVMTRTLADALEWACANGIRRVNLSTGTDLSKTRWRPLCIEYQTLWVFTPSAGGQLSRLLSRLFWRRRYAD
jgi:CelD/BcsL family acetyltransferase involved in cellulose biosynthesis